MTNETLRQLVADAMFRAEWIESGLERPVSAYLSAADAALAAIGLDDVDAAVERAAVPLMAYTRVPDHLARIVLEAALGAVNEAQDG